MSEEGRTIINTSIRILTPCRQAMRKLMIALSRIVDGSWVSSFSYTTSCTCVCQLVWLTYRFKVIDSLMQDAWVSSYKQTDWSWPLIFRTIRLQQRDHSFKYSVFLQLQSWFCIGMFCKRTIFCVSYKRIHILMSLVIVTMKIWTVTVTSPQLVHVNNWHLLLVHWPHNFHTHLSSHLSRQFL